MTDKQIVDVLLKRAAKAGKQIDASLSNPQIVMTQQYGKKLYFNILFDNSVFPHPISFSFKGKTMVFVLPELPERLMDWKRDMIKQMNSNGANALRQFGTNAVSNFVQFDISTFPKEIVHIFSNGIISALNTDGMGIYITAMGLPVLFAPNETYETVQVEADLMEFENE